ncbi:MAG TPA: S4 domain-containing protein, partial [Chitinophagaceae bacterium]|nr:S4 domain-containing protein [Chitinophagaceae bacterium]
MAKHAFEKFINKDLTGAKKKEAIRQQKRKLKQEARARGEERRKQKSEQQRGVWNKEQNTKKEQDKYEARSTNDTNRNPPPERSSRAGKSETRNIKSTNYKSSIKSREQNEYEVRPKNYERKNKLDKKQSNYKRSANPATGNWQPATELMPLNKFVAHAGICGRREAAEMVKEGKVQVNGSVVYEPGFKVSSN